MEHLLTRHAIFDREQKVYAYELAFDTPFDAVYKSTLKEDQKTSKVLTDSFFSLGLDKVTDGKRAFVQFSKNLLVSEFTKMFPKDAIAIQIPVDLKPDSRVVAACKDLKSEGYMIVLDDYAFQTDFMNILPFAYMVKVDAKKIGEYIRKTIVTKLQPRGIKCALKNVNDQQSYYKSFPMGYDYFQGSFFSKPSVVDKKDVPVYKFNFMEMIKQINQPEVDFGKIEDIIKHDVSLTYKLLRMINSSAFGMKNEVKSIKQALVLLGALEVKKWLTLVVLSNIGNDKPDELMKKALLRAKFLELVAPLAGLSENASDLFLTGMFSLMDAMMDQSIESLLDGLPLGESVKNVLLGNDSPYQTPMKLVLDYEKANWTEVKSLAQQMNIPQDKLPLLFKQAVNWVNQISI